VQHPAIPLEQRRSPRVQLALPARVRWHGPLGMRLEVTETADISREGLLVRRKDRCSAGTRVWVAYPFDRGASASEHTETPARVTRVEPVSPEEFRVALQLVQPRKAFFVRPGAERRGSARVYSAVPIFVRTAAGRWPEECMTQDISRNGVRFETCQIYGASDRVLAKIPWSEWERAGEMEGRVVRVSAVNEISIPAPIARPEVGMSAMYTSVAIQWVKPWERVGRE
jgi:hypothetical protein